MCKATERRVQKYINDQGPRFVKGPRARPIPGYIDKSNFNIWHNVDVVVAKAAERLRIEKTLSRNDSFTCVNFQRSFWSVVVLFFSFLGWTGFLKLVDPCFN